MQRKSRRIFPSVLNIQYWLPPVIWHSRGFTAFPMSVTSTFLFWFWIGFKMSFQTGEIWVRGASSEHSADGHLHLFSDSELRFMLHKNIKFWTLQDLDQLWNRILINVIISWSLPPCHSGRGTAWLQDWRSHHFQATGAVASPLQRYLGTWQKSKCQQITLWNVLTSETRFEHLPCPQNTHII